MRKTGRLFALSLAAALLCGEAAAQSRYESMYGSPVDVSIDDLVSMAQSYRGRAVRTKGRLDLNVASGARRVYLLRSLFGNSILVLPLDDVALEFEDAAHILTGRDVEVVGVVGEASQSDSTPTTYVQFWSFTGPPERDMKGPVANLVKLESLVGKPGRHDGQMVRVVGQFRGRNLFGDLPVKSQQASADWVVKDDLYAVWISGRKPKGSGFALDTGLKRDTGKWLEITGRVETRAGITYLRAVQVNLAAPPSATARAAPPAPLPAKPKVPPVVVFALPLDGEAEVPQNSQFVVQFSKDMEEGTFGGRVVLRYTGPRLPGDREFDGLKLTYDQGRKALTVNPGDLLRTGRQVELVLLPGILDTDGLELAPRTVARTRPAEATDVLRFVVGG